MSRLSVTLCVALCAALAAHVAIDVAGDYVLARDTYDALEHQSRNVVALGALGLATVAIAAAVRAALCGACDDERAFCALLRASLPASRRRFIAEIVAGTLFALLAMEALDTAVAGQRSGNLTDLLGGSLWLGPALAILCGVLGATVAWTVLARLGRLHAALARVIAAFVPRTFDEGSAGVMSAHGRHARLVVATPILARRLAGRAPPGALAAAR